MRTFSDLRNDMINVHRMDSWTEKGLKVVYDYLCELVDCGMCCDLLENAHDVDCSFCEYNDLEEVCLENGLSLDDYKDDEYGLDITDYVREISDEISKQRQVLYFDQYMQILGE